VGLPSFDLGMDLDIQNLFVVDSNKGGVAEIVLVLVDLACWFAFLVLDHELFNNWSYAETVQFS
jgi:hypothetical protein